MTYSVGYFIGSLSARSINRTLSKAIPGTLRTPSTGRAELEEPTHPIASRQRSSMPEGDFVESVGVGF